MFSELEDRLVKTCTEAGALGAAMLVTEDLTAKWDEIAPEYMADAVQQFGEYPEFTLACAAYAGMAMARCWDEDWERYHDLPYSSLLGPAGFDDMDDHIVSAFLGMTPGEGDAAAIAELMASCAAEANRALRTSSLQPGSREALLAMAAVAGVMFRLGASVLLHSMGYGWKKCNF